MTGWATYRTLVFLKEYWGSFDGWVGLLGIGWALNEYPDKAYVLLCCAKKTVAYAHEYSSCATFLANPSLF